MNADLFLLLYRSWKVAHIQCQAEITKRIKGTLCICFPGKNGSYSLILTFSLKKLSLPTFHSLLFHLSNAGLVGTGIS